MKAYFLFLGDDYLGIISKNLPGTAQQAAEVTINKGYGLLIASDISAGRNSVFSLANGRATLISTDQAEELTITRLGEFSIKYTSIRQYYLTVVGLR